MSKHVVEIDNFSKKFGKSTVVEDLSFQVEQGEIFAFLGANGSGKTTTIRSLLGIYEPDAGELLINGKRYTVQMAGQLGYLPEERGLYLDAKVLDTLIYFGELKGMESKDAKQRGKEFLERVGLADKEKEKIKKLSSGQQQKIQLGITIINRPDLLILDEPTKGLDPVNRGLLTELLHELNQEEGTTIMFSTHQMEEAEQIANKLVMIKNGKRRLYGEVNKVKQEFGNDIIHLDYSGELKEAKQLFSIIRKETKYAELKMKEGREPKEILETLMKQGLEISRFEVSTPSLHEIFVQVSNEED